MQKTTLATLAFLASVAVASAADLPSKAAPVAPKTPAFVDTNYYVGYNVGALKGTDRVYSGGAVAGWNALSFLAVEGSYNYNYDDVRHGARAHNTHTFVGSIVPQYRIPGTDLTPYLVAGAGYRLDNETANHTVYNYGGGVKYGILKNADLDFRYTRTEAVDISKYRGVEEKFTAGVNYKF